jgi:hypothetical protein
MEAQREPVKTRALETVAEEQDWCPPTRILTNREKQNGSQKSEASGNWPWEWAHSRTNPEHELMANEILDTPKMKTREQIRAVGVKTGRRPQNPR